MSSVYAAIDLGGTNLKGAFGSEEGELLTSESIPTESHQGPEAVLERMAKLVKKLRERTGARPEGLGIGVPGLVDMEHGVTKFLPNLQTQWRDVSVRESLEPKVGCPVYLLNDVRAATLGELTFGHGREIDNLVFFAIGTGIGGGIALNGKLRLGPLGAAGELGHLTILPEGPPCGCGNRGCLETLASGPALAGAGVRLLRAGLANHLHEIVEGDPGKVTPKTMSQAIERGDDLVKEEVTRAARYLGLAAAHMVTALHPELIVLGGGVAEMGELLLEPIRETIRERIKMIPTDEILVKTSLLGKNAGMLGGIALAVRQGSVGS